MNYYFMLEQYIFPHWVSAGIILEGDYHKHLVLLETLRKKFAPIDFRAKRISDKATLVFATHGMKIMTAPEVLKNV
jgi:hypothetical protein